MSDFVDPWIALRAEEPGGESARHRPTGVKAEIEHLLPQSSPCISQLVETFSLPDRGNRFREWWGLTICEETTECFLDALGLAGPQGPGNEGPEGSRVGNVCLDERFDYS